MPLRRLGQQTILRWNSQPAWFSGCRAGSKESWWRVLGRLEAIMGDQQDRQLGMHRNITRRDFLNGVAVTAGAAIMPWHLLAGDDSASPEKPSRYYPPAL